MSPLYFVICGQPRVELRMTWEQGLTARCGHTQATCLVTILSRQVNVSHT
jgi:hypothetical protein